VARRGARGEGRGARGDRGVMTRDKVTPQKKEQGVQHEMGE
jgi:hypothetical protein